MVSQPIRPINQKQRSWVKGFGPEDEHQVPLTCRQVPTTLHCSHILRQ